ncbi:hypothetical protein ACJMK2_027370 [Sinanodonta woodiana]|uniref:Uncharacterized protein n=1 Tax=Sinanodonta woodiana TaxID=1069815 RepID=A0ABD3XR09_SINWO
MSARFQCKTIGCSFPDPIIQWMYENQNISSGIQTLASDGCTSPEKIYASTLFFQRYSTLSDNSDQTVFFSCIADYPDVSKIIRANATKTVRFAVRVTEVVLQQNNKNITDIMTVNLGEPVTLTCITGLSRPDPSIDWYIGSQKRGNGPSLNFTPSNDDHNQTIYCQAYNTDPNKIIYSLKPRLSVQVRVTEAVLHQNGQTISSTTLIVTSGKPTTLSCVTGNSRPDAKIDWFIGSEQRGNGTSLNFIPTSQDHDKAVYCQAYNIDPNQPVFSDKPILFVKAAPRILDVSPDYKGYVGQYVVIQFDFYSNIDENLTITARHSNSSGLIIHQGIIKPAHPDDPPSVFRAYFFIILSNDNDLGLYAVEVKNAVGSDSKNIRIIEQITPEKPSSFHATDIQETQLSLRWQAGYNGGYTQTFIVEISHNNITWNNASQVSAENRDGWFTTVIEDLIPGSEYYLRLYAYNINGRGDLADVQLAIRTLKETMFSSLLDFIPSVEISVGGAVGAGVGGAVGVGVGGAVGGIIVGLIGAIIACTIRRQLNGSKCSCLRSKRRTDDELHSYSNTEMNPQTVKPIYEELNKGNTEQRVYDKISPLEG